MPGGWFASGSMFTESPFSSDSLNLGNYAEVFRRIPFGRGWWNSTVVTSLATLQGSQDLAFGNVVGSNIFNLLAVAGALGTTGVADPDGVDPADHAAA